MSEMERLERLWDVQDTLASHGHKPGGAVYQNAMKAFDRSFPQPRYITEVGVRTTTPAAAPATTTLPPLQPGEREAWV